jgi:hypothetical protein
MDLLFNFHTRYFSCLFICQGQAGIQQSTGEEVIIGVVQDDDGASSSSHPLPSHE